MADIEEGLVDVVVVYKIDRLSRSLMDFSRLVEVFDRAGVTFVSVTQSFNTTTSMGRLTLNILLSFAQFEREVTAERIRDKIRASRQKGMFMGGNVPLGLRGEGPEADRASTRMRRSFARSSSASSGSARRRCWPVSCGKEGIRTKRGKLVDKGYLYKLLNNRIYLGMAVHKGTAYPGEHAAIIPQDLWGIPEDEAREALTQLDPLWDELFPAEQARIVQLLVERVDVRMHGVEVRLRPNGLAGLVREVAGNRRAAA